MKIFITGIAGFLGSHLADKFIAEGHEVSGNDNLLLGDEDNIPLGVQSWVNIDCCDLVNKPDILKGFDVVYHCAATAHEGLSVFSPSFITKNIYEASVSTFSAAIQAGVKRIVYCSSMARYGRGAYTKSNMDNATVFYWNPPFKEHYPVSPLDPYGIAKVAAENTLKALAEVHGVEYVIAVPHNIIGLRQNYTDPFRNVASIMINRMKQGKSPIIYGDGRQIRCFSPVVDVIDTLAKLATEEGINGEVFNVGPDDGELTIMQLANKISDILDVPMMPIFMPDRPLEVKSALCSSDKIRERFGYKLIQTVDECLKQMCKAIEPKPFNYNLPIEIVSDKTPRTWSERMM